MVVNRVLIVADELNGDSAILARAIRFAGTQDAQLTLLRKTGKGDEILEDPDIRSGLQDATLKEYETSPDSDLVSMSEQQDALIIKTASRQPGGLSRLFRNPDAEFARKSPCSTWIIKSVRDSNRRSRILAVIDPISTSPESQGLAARVLDTAVTLAKNEQADVHLFAAWEITAEAMLRGRTIHVSDVKRLLKQIGAAHEKHVHRLASDFDYPRIKVHVRKGRADRLVRHFVAKRGIDDVVIGVSNGQDKLARRAPDGELQRYLDAAGCSVFAVKSIDGAVESATA